MDKEGFHFLLNSGPQDAFRTLYTARSTGVLIPVRIRKENNRFEGGKETDAFPKDGRVSGCYFIALGKMG